MENEFESDEDMEVIDTKKSRKRKPPKAPKQQSDIWLHFKRVKNLQGELRAVCNYCKTDYASQPKKHGISSLWNHLKVCSKNPNKQIDKKQKVLCLEPKQGCATTHEGQLEAVHYKFAR